MHLFSDIFSVEFKELSNVPTERSLIECQRMRKAFGRRFSEAIKVMARRNYKFLPNTWPAELEKKLDKMDKKDEEAKHEAKMRRLKESRVEVKAESKSAILRDIHKKTKKNGDKTKKVSQKQDQPTKGVKKKPKDGSKTKKST